MLYKVSLIIIVGALFIALIQSNLEQGREVERLKAQNTELVTRLQTVSALTEEMEKNDAERQKKAAALERKLAQAHAAGDDPAVPVDLTVGLRAFH